MSVNSQVILFSIQAAVRLEGQVRQVQIDKIRDNSLNLLTPKFTGLNFKSAVRWFTRDGAASIANNPNFINLVHRAERRDDISGSDKQRLIDEYIQRRNVQDGLVKIDTSIGLSSDNIFAISNVTQWQKNKGRYPSPLQRICGSLIEIGIDYFKNYSSLINTNTTQGKMLMSLFDAIDDIDFAEGQLQDIGSKMMVASLEVMDQGVDLISGGSNATLLFKSITKGIITDINTYVSSEGVGNLFKQEQAREWGQLVFKSVLTTAGKTVLDNPSKFLSTGSGASEMVTSVGNSLLSSILEDVDAGDGVVVSLKNVFTTDTLSKVTQASFEVLAQNPEWYDIDNEGLKNVLTALIKEVATYPNSLGMDMLPDLATLILTQTAGNLQLIYQGDPTDSANNLLVTATGLVIRTLQQGIPTEDGQPWQPVFTKTQIVALVDGVLQEVVSNPDWILAKAEDANPLLEDVLTAVFKSLQGVSVGSMSTETKMSIIKSAISAVALRQDLLDQLNIDGKETQLLNYGIDIVLDLAFGQKANAKTKWALANSLTISLLIDGVLSRIAKEGASEEVINLTKEFLDSEIQVLTNGQPFDINTVVAQLKSGNTLQQLLQNSINAATRITATLLSENPNAIKIGNEGVKSIVNHLVQTLASYPSDINAALLPRLALMIITDTSANLGTIVGASTDDPAKNLLVLAGQTALNQLGSEDESGKISFNYTTDQAMNLLDTVFQNVVSNPTWVLDAAGNTSPILENALSAAMSSLKEISLQNMSNDTKINVLKSAVSAVALRQDLLNKVNIDGEEKALLSGGIEIVLNLAFGQKATAKAKWALMSNQVMGELMNAVLGRLAKEGASKSVLNLVDEFLNGELEALSDGGNFDIDTVISKLKSGATLDALLQNSINAATRITATLLSENPNAIKIGNEGVKNIVNHLVQTLASYPSDINAALLPRLALMIITDTSANLGTIVGASTDDPAKNLLVLAGQTALNQLGSEDENGKISFNYTTDQAMNLLDTVFQNVVSNPTWVLDAAGNTSPILENALSAAMSSLKEISLQNMSNDTKINVLKSAVSAVALRQDLLNKVNIDGEEKALLSGGIEIVLNLAFGQKATAKAKWALMSNQVMGELMNAVLGRLAKEGASKSVLNLVDEFLNGELEALSDGGTFDIDAVISKLKSGATINSLLQNSINAVTRITATLIAENIDHLKINNEGVKNIVTHLAATLANYPTDFSRSILPNLASMVLLDTSDNLAMMAGADANDPTKNLLVLAGQIVLNTLGETGSDGKMTMKYTTDQAMDLLDDVLQQVISKPEWILAAANETNPLLEEALKAALTSLGTAKVLNLSNDAAINILKAAISAVAMDRGFMDKVGVNSEFVMSMSLDVVFKTAQGDLSSANLSAELTAIITETAKEKIRWALSDNDSMEELTEAVLRRVVKEGTSETTIESVNTLLAHEVVRIAKGEPFSISDLIDQLDSPDRLIDLIAGFVTPN